MSSYNENNEYTCEFCSRAFKTRQAKGAHNGCCPKNPNRTRFARWKYAKHTKPKADPLETVRKIRERLTGICRFCGKDSGCVKVHEKHCRQNPNWKHAPNYGSHLTDAQKQKRSEQLRKYRREHPDKTVAFIERWHRNPSYPETWVATVIENEFVDKKYVKEMHFFQYALDFAWPHKLLCIEIDGRLHDEADRMVSDHKKDALLKQNGWRVLRLSWVDCFHEPKRMIQIMREFVDLGKEVPHEKRWRSKAELEAERLLKKYGENPRRRIDGRIATCYIEDTEWERRKALLDKYDKSKFGWISQSVRETGLSLGIIIKTCKHFGIEYRTTNHTSANNWRNLQKKQPQQLELFYN